HDLPALGDRGGRPGGLRGPGAGEGVGGVGGGVGGDVTDAGSGDRGSDGQRGHAPTVATYARKACPPSSSPPRPAASAAPSPRSSSPRAGPTGPPTSTR